RVIALVVAMLAVTHHVYKYIRLKFFAVAGSYFSAFYHSFGIVAIYVQNRRLHHGCQRSAIIGTARIIKIRGKPDLVIDYKMNGAPRMVSFQLAHLQYFVYDALSGNRSITMDQDGQHFFIISFM